MIDFTKELLVLLGFIIAIAVLCIVVREKKESDNGISGSEKNMDDTQRTSADSNDKRMKKKGAVAE